MASAVCQHKFTTGDYHTGAEHLLAPHSGGRKWAKTDQQATPETSTGQCQKIRNNRRGHIFPFTTDHLWSEGTGWQGMPMLPPPQGFQILYMQAKTNSKIKPSILSTVSFKDTRFMQGAVHTPGEKKKKRRLSCSQFSTSLLKPYNPTGFFWKKNAFSSRLKRLQWQTPANGQFFSTLLPFPPTSWSVRSADDSRAEPNPGRTLALRELQIQHANEQCST